MKKKKTFNGQKISKSNFYKNKKPSEIGEIDVKKILISKKESYGTKKPLKYFIGHNNNEDLRPLCINLPQMIEFDKYFDSNKALSFKANDNELLKKYATIWDSVSSLMNLKFDREPIYGGSDKYIKTKTYWDKVNTNFQGKKVQKENTSYKCLSLIMLHFVIRANKKYHQQTLLEECKYEIKNNKMENLIYDDFAPSLFLFLFGLVN